jgi:hypothetical protein
VFFRSGRFDPSTPAGMALLAHELVHVHQVENAALGPSPIDGVMDDRQREQAALGIERMTYRLLEPTVPMVWALPLARGTRREGVEPTQVSSIAPQSSPVRSASSSAVPPGPMRAAEGRRMDVPSPTADASSDPAEVASQVYRILERRLRYDRERLGLWRHTG